MEEKILIKSEVNKTAKSCFLGIMVGFWIITIAFLLYLLLPNDSPFGMKWEYNNFDMALIIGGTYLVTLVIGCIFFVLAIIVTIVYWSYSKCQIAITDKNVKGKTLFGKEVVLPLYMVSAYTTRKFLSTIAVATSSVITKFVLIKNYTEIGNVLSQLINKRQDQTQTIANETKTISSNMDDLVKLKDLLEQGIITQEEFDAKKKQLLGL